MQNPTRPLRRRTAVILSLTAAGLLLSWRLVHDRHPDAHRLASRSLGKTRRLLVHEPEGYAREGGPYPLLVLLDGGDRRQFSGDRPLYSRACQVLATLQKQGLPPMILVGIDNRERVRDMTPIERPDIYVGGGGGEPFMRFIELEVLPWIEARWRVGPTRILYGESYGGLFVLDALARGRQAFTSYVAVSPAVGVWPDALASAFRQRFVRPASVRNAVVVYGERDVPLTVDYTPAYVSAIRGSVPAEMRFHVEVVPGEGHNPESSLERALRFIFQGQGVATSAGQR